MDSSCFSQALPSVHVTQTDLFRITGGMCSYFSSSKSKHIEFLFTVYCFLFEKCHLVEQLTWQERLKICSVNVGSETSAGTDLVIV